MKVRVELPQRCWIEAQIELDDFKNTLNANWNAQGSFELIKSCEKFFSEIVGKNLNQVQVQGVKTHQLLLDRLIAKAKGEYKEFDASLETCHCRKISQGEIEMAILLGAHTPEKVKKWTSASSGCGTCRPDVEQLIAVCLKKA